MRRGAIVQLTLLSLLIGGVVTVVAVYPHWLPPTASEQADRIDFVFWSSWGGFGGPARRRTYVDEGPAPY